MTRDRRKGRGKKEQEEEWRKKGNAGGKGMKGEKKRGGERWGWVIRSDADNNDDEEGDERRWGGYYKREGRGHIKKGGGAPCLHGMGAEMNFEIKLSSKTKC